MEKTRLSLDDLEIQSFATTGDGARRRGTVRGHDAPTDPVECPTLDQAWDTCWDTCADSCNCGGGGGPSDYCSYDCGSYWCSWDCSWTWYISWC